MTDDEENEKIMPNTNRRLQRTRTRRKLFGVRRQEIFLDALAASCNVAASAAAAGVCAGAVYAQRRKNPAFRDAWNVALEQGYARLEAALLERAERGLDRPRIGGAGEAGGPSTGSGQAGGGAAETPVEPDWDKAMDLLRQHRRGLDGAPHRGGHVTRRIGAEALRERIVRKLKAIGYRVEEDEVSGAGGTSSGADTPPPSCGRAPSPSGGGSEE